MCGITGIGFERVRDRLKNIEAMASTLTHRGPDDHGVWVNSEKGIAFGFRRLAINDLSEAGHQPMHSKSGRYIIVFNGEIYNFKEIASDLLPLGWTFRGHSDTEVLLAAVETWGVEKSLKKFNGMFAFALWDNQDNALYLARDRFGEKPLYWGWSENSLVFASELKALRQYKALQLDIDRHSLNLFMRYSYIPAPYCIYKNIEKVEPGYYLKITGDKKVVKTAYWSAESTVRKIKEKNVVLNQTESVLLLEKALQKSISLRTIADVPLGSFLSGGIDSSLVTALMQENSNKPINTFTIGFCEQRFNEAPYAKAVAEHLGTHHTELYVTNKETMDVIPKLPYLYDEPFADSSQIPTYLVSQLARQSVTVCLSGDAGDELFGGYNRYVWGAHLFDKASSLPSPFRKGFSHFLNGLHPEHWETLHRKLNRFLPSSLKIAALSDKIVKLTDALQSADSLMQFYTSLTSIIKNPDNLILESGNGYPLQHLNKFSPKDSVSWMMLADTLGYLPGDILTKVDRASMGVSLEARVPFLDVDVFELAWKLPPHMKIRDKKGKIALRELLYKRVPQHLIERPKMGFGIPVGEWLRGPLKDWAEDLLSEKHIKEQGFLNPSVVRTYWNDHCSRKRDRTHEIWNILMFQAWLKEWH
jgi:asparagine synthase (glutamine-hydrolysing)